MEDALISIDRLRFVEISKGGTRPLVGGLTITEYHDTSEVPGAGTLGCIAKRKSGSQHVILTCQHILASTGSLTSPETDPKHLARQPGRRACSLIFHYENIVGPIVMGRRDNVIYNGKSFWIDAAIANVNSDVHTSNEVQLIGALQGKEDLSWYVANPASLPKNYAVKKTGRSTPLTKGVISQLVPTKFLTDPRFTGGATARNLMLINPVPPYFKIKETYTIDPSQKNGIMNDVRTADIGNLVTMTDNGSSITFEMNVFAVAGDSGSVLVNDQQKVVGLICAASSVDINTINEFGDKEVQTIWTGMALACHIEPVLQEMDIDIIQGPETTGGDPLDIDEVLLEEAEYAPDLEMALERIEEDIRLLPHGGELMKLVQRHGEEMIRLVHHYRPVKLVWHRNQCPGFAISIVNAIRDRAACIQKEIKGVNISEAAANLCEALNCYGSPGLQRDLGRYGNMAVEAISTCDNYSSMIDFFHKKMNTLSTVHT